MRTGKRRSASAIMGAELAATDTFHLRSQGGVHTLLGESRSLERSPRPRQECEGLHEARRPEEDQQRVASQLLLRRDPTHSTRISRSVLIAARSICSAGPGAVSQRNSDSYHQPRVKVATHAMKRTKRSMQSPLVLRTHNKRFFIGLRRGTSGCSSSMAMWC
jgi:hypothetical protein